MAHDTFAVGDLTAIVGDNAAHGEHRAGYNGLWSLMHTKEPTNLFVPTVAGFNLEHIFDGETLDGMPNQSDIFFEPRRAKMTFRKLSATSCELHQPETPTFHLESRTTFQFREPDAIDIAFQFKAHQHAFRRGYLGLFWASYINAPEDKSLYLRGKDQWLQHCTPAHNALSTVKHASDPFDLTFAPNHRDCLYKSLSPLKYDLPLAYGHFRNMTFLMMFDRTSGIRFTHSPSGGGFHAGLQTTNPAWDFQYILPKYDVMTEYSFRARLVYRPRMERPAILALYDRWAKESAGR
jgi:hypothetical protein